MSIEATPTFPGALIEVTPADPDGYVTQADLADVAADVAELEETVADIPTIIPLDVGDPIPDGYVGFIFRIQP